MIRITAQVQNGLNHHHTQVSTNGKVQSLNIPPKESGFGSSLNGGELLFLALATCYCNDIYREAAALAIQVEGVEVEVAGDFGAEGEPARNLVYRAQVTAHASQERIQHLMQITDRKAEIQNTLRAANMVPLQKARAVSI
jgi:organic hydroperoxide reductase OsmC/OhrA